MDAKEFPTIRRAGSDALLLDCTDLDSALRLLRILKVACDAGDVTVEDLVPAAQTVMVRGGDAAHPGRFAGILAELLAHASPDELLVADAEEIRVPVMYDGGDLDEVARLTGLSVSGVIARHTAARYNVAFTGFAPGFAYLSGGDPHLVVPRRATPRSRILAGAVGLAGAFSGVYPRESPGGWQLVGHTDAIMWDIQREHPALLQPGARVRFELTRERIRVADAPTAGPPSDVEAAHGTAILRIRDAGLQTLVVDRGRPGLASLGVSASGAADRGALARANRAVGNDSSAAALELSHGGFEAEVMGDAVVVLSGALRSISVAGPLGTHTPEMETPFRLTAGEILRIGGPNAGLRSVVAVRGGVAAARVLGSRSRDTLAGLGPEPLRAGDSVKCANGTVRAVRMPVPPPFAMPRAGAVTVLDVVLGPRSDWFSDDAVRLLQTHVWNVSTQSDRVGVRLTGEALTRAVPFMGQELPSEGLVSGAIQVPPDGQPIVFLADHPLTGGYPVIAVVHERHLDVAAQLPPGAQVRFRVVGNVEKILP